MLRVVEEEWSKQTCWVLMALVSWQDKTAWKLQRSFFHEFFHSFENPRDNDISSTHPTISWQMRRPVDVAENRDKSNHRERYSEGRIFSRRREAFCVWTTFYFLFGLEGGRHDRSWWLLRLPKRGLRTCCEQISESRFGRSVIWRKAMLVHRIIAQCISRNRQSFVHSFFCWW